SRPCHSAPPPIVAEPLYWINVDGKVIPQKGSATLIQYFSLSHTNGLSTATVSPRSSCRSGSLPFFRSSSDAHIGTLSPSLTSIITYRNGSREPSRTL